MGDYYKKTYGNRLIYNKKELENDLKKAFQLFLFEYYLIVEINDNKISVTHNISARDSEVLAWVTQVLNQGGFGNDHLGSKQTIIVQISWRDSNTIGIEHPEGLKGYTRDKLRELFNKHSLSEGFYAR
jgi:hypothetical protein